MSGKTKVETKVFEEAMRAEFEKTMRGVMEAVNAAPQGEWIEGSEHQVHDLMVAFQQKAYEKALQMRTQAAEAAFSPSASRDAGEQPAVQRMPGTKRTDGRRTGGGAAPGIHGQGIRPSVASG
jgi:hypothetical protein